MEIRNTGDNTLVVCRSLITGKNGTGLINKGYIWYGEDGTGRGIREGWMGLTEQGINSWWVSRPVNNRGHELGGLEI